jgi:hypothetical protein
MTRKEFSERTLNGELLACVEYRGAAARRFEADAAKNKGLSIQIRHRVELKGGEQLEIVEYIKDENAAKFDVKKFNDKPFPFKAQDRVVWHMEKYIGWSKTGKQATGSLEELTA